jgi:hypothetical protein
MGASSSLFLENSISGCVKQYNQSTIQTMKKCVTLI